MCVRTYASVHRCAHPLPAYILPSRIDSHFFSLPMFINPFYKTEKWGSYYPQYISYFVIPFCIKPNSHCHHLTPWAPASHHRLLQCYAHLQIPSLQFSGAKSFFGSPCTPLTFQCALPACHCCPPHKLPSSCSLDSNDQQWTK